MFDLSFLIDTGTDRRIDNEEARLFEMCPSAFWNDPDRWYGIDDPHKQMFWMVDPCPPIHKQQSGRMFQVKIKDTWVSLTERQYREYERRKKV